MSTARARNTRPSAHQRGLLAISFVLNTNPLLAAAQNPISTNYAIYPASTTLATSIIPTTYSSNKYDDDDTSYTQSATYPTSTSSTSSNPSDDDGWFGDMSSYYYIFIAVFVLACIVALYFSHKRRRARRLRRQNGVHSALLQDAAGWPNNRRWIHGNLPPETTRDGRGLEVERNEGLDERGQAPPPYKSAERGGGVGGDGTGVGEGLGESVAAPPRVADVTKPPEYDPRWGR